MPSMAAKSSQYVFFITACASSASFAHAVDHLALVEQNAPVRNVLATTDPRGMAVHISEPYADLFSRPHLSQVSPLPPQLSAVAALGTPKTVSRKRERDPETMPISVTVLVNGSPINVPLARSLNCKTAYRGVHPVSSGAERGRYRGEWSEDGKKRKLQGSFKTAEEAARAMAIQICLENPPRCVEHSVDKLDPQWEGLYLDPLKKTGYLQVTWHDRGPKPYRVKVDGKDKYFEEKIDAARAFRLQVLLQSEEVESLCD